VAALLHHWNINRMILIATTILGVIIGASLAVYIRRKSDPFRMRPSAAAKYYRLEFKERDEAAAFMAALSRFLVSPDAAGVVQDAEPAEVWTSMQETGDTLYLNETSFRAAKLAFSPVPTSAPIQGAQIPRHTALSLTGFSARRIGMDEAAKRMG
jgi:hypothetical protein